MSGATDFFFTMVLAAIFLFFFGLAAITVIKKLDGWMDGRKTKKLRFWLLRIFDDQLDQLRFNMEQEKIDPLPYGLALSHLRWELSISDYFFRDLEKFRDGGIPVLLSCSDGCPKLFLGVSEAGKEIKLSEHSILFGLRKTSLNEQDIAFLKSCYPVFSGESFTALRVFTGKDAVALEEQHE